MNKKRLDLGSKLYIIMTKLSALFTFGILFFIVGYILFKGIGHLKPNMFELVYTTTNNSMVPSIITTLIIVVLALFVSCPIGIFTGFYLVEYSKKGSKIVEIVRISAETLAGIPSIVYGLFGMLFFVFALNLGFSIISGVLTVSIMILPLIIRSTEEALLSVNDSLRNGSFALGAGKLRTIFKVILPIAMPGILSGIILSIGRVIGETAALFYTLGTSTNMPTSIFKSGRTLSLHMYVLSSEGHNVGEAYATGVVLLIIVVIINQLSMWLSNKLTGVNT